MKNNTILAIQATSLPPLAEGFNPTNQLTASAIGSILDINTAWWGPRPLLEEDPSFRQYIPYAVIRVDGKLLRYRRPAKGNEDRLAGKTSIGFGGHIELQDHPEIQAPIPNYALSLEDVFVNALARELFEEINLDIAEAKNRPSIAGVIKNSVTPVDQVHLGIVYVLDVPATANFRVDPNEITEISLVTAEELEANDKLENWSKAIFRHLMPQQSAVEPANA